MAHVATVLHDPADMPLADLPFGLRIRARAYTEDGERYAGRLLSATVHVARGCQHDALLMAHEVGLHVMRDLDNGGHHPWWHFCGLVGHALRTRRHLTAQELRKGRELARDGWTDA